LPQGIFRYNTVKFSLQEFSYARLYISFHFANFLTYNHKKKPAISGGLFHIKI